MFVFKAVSKKKSSKIHCYFDQSDSSKRSIYSCHHKKNVFFARTLLSLFLMSGYAAANVGGSYNGTSPTDSSDAPGTVISCSDLKNLQVRNQCKDFISSHEGEYTVRYLPKGEPITSYDSFNVYIIPPGDITFIHHLKIKDAQNIAFIGDIGADRNYPTLRGAIGYSEMFLLENCQNCMVANVDIDPINGDMHSIPFWVSGDKTEIELRNIKVTHSYIGLLQADDAKSIIFDNVGTTYDHEKEGSKSIKYFNSAIALRNCDKIKAKNVWLHEVGLSSITNKYPHIISILNPVDVELEDISIGLDKDHDPSEGLAYIGMAFKDMDKYTQPGGSKVKVEMKGLHFGVYTGRDSNKHITVPDNWPKNRHVLSLSKRSGSIADTTKVTGEIVIEKNEDLDAIISQPGVQAVTGEDLFYNLKVTFADLISPTLKLSTPGSTFTPNSSFIPNSTSAPKLQRQEGDDSDSGWTVGQIAGTVIGVVVGIFIAGAAYKYRGMILPLVMSSIDKIRPVRYQRGGMDEEVFVETVESEGPFDEENAYNTLTRPLEN